MVKFLLWLLLLVVCWPLALLALVLGLMALGVSTGPVAVSLADAVAALTGGAVEPTLRSIVLDYRLPRALAAALAGLALALAGGAMQTLMANPLAGPDVLGVSAGASLGVALSLLAGPLVGAGLLPPALLAPELLNLGTTALAVGGAAAVMAGLVVAARWLSTATLLLLGLMVATAATGVISLLQFAAGAEAGRAYLIWSFGSVAGSTWAQLPVLAGAVALGGAVVLAQSGGLDLLRLGPLTAQAMGVRLPRLRLWLLLGTSLLTGAVTAVCGPIAFVGVAVPHLARRLDTRPAHRHSLVSIGLMGAVVLLACDQVSQLLPGGRVVPLNAVTAVVGAPVVAWVILTRMDRSGGA